MQASSFPAKFEPFLMAYYDHFKFLSIDSYQFKEFFEKHFEEVAKVRFLVRACMEFFS